MLCKFFLSMYIICHNCVWEQNIAYRDIKDPSTNKRWEDTTQKSNAILLSTLYNLKAKIKTQKELLKTKQLYQG